MPNINEKRKKKKKLSKNDNCNQFLFFVAFIQDEKVDLNV